MKIIKQTTSQTVVTIGNFDGLHKGHLKLIQKTKQIAENTSSKAWYAVLTVIPRGHRQFFREPNSKKGFPL